MAKTLTDAIAAIQPIALTVSDGTTTVTAAPNDPKEAIAEFPFVVSYPAKGTLELETYGPGKDKHIIYTELHLSRNVLNEAVAKAKLYLEDFAAKIKADTTLSGASDTIVWPIPYTFGSLDWAGENHLGFRFEITVKIRKPVST